MKTVDHVTGSRATSMAARAKGIVNSEISSLAAQNRTPGRNVQARQLFPIPASAGFFYLFAGARRSRSAVDVPVAEW